MFSTKSLKVKMILAFSGIAFCLLIVGGVSIYFLQDVSTKYSHVTRYNFTKSVLLAKMRGITKDIRGKIYLIGIESEKDVLQTESELRSLLKAYDESDIAFKELPFVGDEETIYNTQHDGWKIFSKDVLRMLQLRKNTPSTNLVSFQKILISEFENKIDAYLKELQALIEFQNSESDKWQKNAEQSRVVGNASAVTVSILGLILAMSVGFIFSTLLSRRLKSLAEKLDNEARAVASISQQVSSAGTELSSSTTEQAAALQETVASLEEVSAMVGKNADNAKQSQEVAAQGQELANRGNQIVSEMIKSIDEISQSNAEIMKQIENSNLEISQIVKVIAEIGDKTKVINDIVFQTKLLSFNASVEAARAGEHGKGFAVVAEEVGNLAQMSGTAAKEISAMLENSIQKVEATVNSTKSKVEVLIRAGKAKVEAGSVTAKKCGEVLDEVVRNVARVGEMVSEIATASAEQAQGVGEINKAMAQMDQVTQQNANGSQQAASAAERLTQQATSLRSIVQTLVITVDGGSPPPEAKTLAHVQTKEATVIELKRSRPKTAVREQSLKEVVRPSFKTAVGAEQIPSQNDPRFEDV